MKALPSVVIITTLEVSTPSCPIFFAMMKQLTAEEEPVITRIATSCWSRKPSMAASGSAAAEIPTRRISVHPRAGRILASALLPWKLAPMAIRPRGVASTPRL